MANEITISASLQAQKPGSGIDVKLARGPVSFTMSGDSATEFYQTVGTSEEALELGQDIGTPGMLIVENLDATNYVSFRRATGESNFCKVGPGRFALFELEATAPFVIANTAAVRIRCLLLEA